MTGAPGTGKTSVIAELANRFPTVREPARELIAAHRAATGEGTLDARPELFVRRLVARSIADFHGVPGHGVVFFDRGLPDCAAYASVFGLDPLPVLKEARGLHYASPVFVAPPWEEIHTQDDLRRATFAEVLAFDAQVRRAYGELGYEVVELPRTSVAERAGFILERLGLTGGS